MRTFRPVEDRNLWTENHTSFFKNDVGDILHARFVAVNPAVLSDVSIIDERDNTTYSDNGELGLLCHHYQQLNNEVDDVWYWNAHLLESVYRNLITITVNQCYYSSDIIEEQSVLIDSPVCGAIYIFNS